MDKCKVIAVTNQKGGVGKTITTVNLGVGLVEQGKRVLLVDADPQSSLTVSLGAKDPDKLDTTIADLMQVIVDNGDLSPLDKGIMKDIEGVDLVHSNIGLSSFEVSLVNTMSREFVLRSYLGAAKRDYDYVLIDCMPSLGMLTMVNNRTNNAKSIITSLRQTGSNLRVLNTEIPYSVRAAECSVEGKSIFAHDGKGKVEAAYTALVEEVSALEQRNRDRPGAERSL